MPRPPATPSIDAQVRDAVDAVVKRASVSIARTLAQLAAERLEAELASEVARAGRGKGRRARPARGELSRWAADRRARRVPTFVIELTGLKTKKQIVARYGDGVVFEKGKPAPRPKG
jgi:hypothetical protein